jgi:oxygen-independent coproporphyrinogen-3 oxidase
MKAALSWEGVEEVTFECEPGTLTEKKLHAIREMGVTRLSLGVEHFDDGILESNGRAHGAKEIPRAYHYARHVGFPQINIDLIAGMMGETTETWRRCVEQAIALEPDSITVYQMEIPYNTTFYKQMKAEAVAPTADWATKRGWLDHAFAEFERAGYTVGSAYTVVKSPATTRFVYRDALWHGADMIGIGVSSFGKVNGTHLQNEKDIAHYVAAVNEGRLPLQRAMPMTDEEQLIREFILQMKLGRLETAYFERKFHVDVRRRFAAPLDRLESAGYLAVGDDEIRMTRKGLLRVDALLGEFFLPEHRA